MQHIFSRRDIQVSKAAIFLLQCTAEEENDLLFGEFLQDVNAGARKQRGDDLERRILGGRADQADASLLDMREECILLRFIESVDLVDEDDGAGTELLRLFGIGHHGFDLFYAGKNGGELDEIR